MNLNQFYECMTVCGLLFIIYVKLSNLTSLLLFLPYRIKYKPCTQKRTLFPQAQRPLLISSH